MKIKPKYPLILAIVSVLIITIGLMIKPDLKDQAPQITEIERARLQELSQKRSLQDMSRYFARLTAKVAPGVVQVEPGPNSGLWITDGYILTSAGGRRGFGEVRVRRDDLNMRGAYVTGPANPLQVVKLEGPGNAPREITLGGPPAPGSWVVVAVRDEDGAIMSSPAMVSGLKAGGCDGKSFAEMSLSTPLSRESAGGVVFDINAAVVGLVVACESEVTVLAVPDLSQLTASGVESSGEETLAAGAGLRCRIPGEGLRKMLQAPKGVLVETVWDESPAEKAGLKPGDVIVEAGGAALEDAAGLSQIWSKQPAVLELSVRRWGRTLKMTVERAPKSETGAGLRTVGPPAGVVLANPRPGSAAARAGLRSGDLLQEVDGRNVTGVSEAERLMARPGPHVAVVARNGRKVLIEIAAEGGAAR